MLIDFVDINYIKRVLLNVASKADKKKNEFRQPIIVAVSICTSMFNTTCATAVFA